MYILFVFSLITHFKWTVQWGLTNINFSQEKTEHIHYSRKSPWAPSFTVNSYALPQAATVLIYIWLVLPVYRTAYIVNGIRQCYSFVLSFFGSTCFLRFIYAVCISSSSLLLISIPCYECNNLFIHSAVNNRHLSLGILWIKFLGWSCIILYMDMFPCKDPWKHGSWIIT